MLDPGTRLGVYEVHALLGAGAMGEVYRATDTRLQREIAIKLLPPSLVGDPERAARFSREAQILASLNHPHIGAIYGLEKTDGGEFLVLELVDGDTLDTRIARGPIPVEDALVVAAQIAEALEAAHDKGIVHRDLKPSNIALTADGQVKVLDFGLAKLAGASAAPPPSGSLAPTMASPALVTGVGSLLGTAAYMSPEQAKGKEADRRSDVWAFGCVLFEMLTGRRAFAGEAVSETIANVLKSDPDWSLLPGDTPPAVRLLLKGCLERNPRQRLGDLSAARLLMSDTAHLADTPPRPRARSGWILLAGCASAAALLIAAGYTIGLQSGEPAAARMLELSLPVVFNFGAPAAAVLSPDGRRLAYIAPNEQGRLDVLVKELDGIRVTRVADTNGAHSPFWSPDNQWIAYYDGNRLMRAMPGGGPPEMLTPREGPARGGDWNERGDILFTDGADIKRLSIGDPARTVSPVVSNARFPAFLPDGKRFLYNDRQSNALLLATLGGGPPQKVLANTGQTLVSSTGHLLFARDGALLLAPFDLKRGMVTGDAAALDRRVYQMRDTGGMGVSIDRQGTLIVSTAVPNFAALRWHHLDTTRVEDSGLDPIAIGAAGIDLSRDGSRAAISRVDDAGQSDVWISELSRPNLSRLTADPRNEGDPVWAPDGRSVVFTRQDTGTAEVVQRAVDRADPERVILSMDGLLRTTAWTPDGASIVFSHDDELWLAPVTGQSAPRRLVRGVQGQVSRDGVWLAYASDETGAFEVYVQRLADGSDRRQLSTQGGHMPRWASGGAALTYVRFTGDLMWVSFDLKSGSAGVPVKTLRIPVTTRSPVFRYGLFERRVFVAENSTTAPPHRVVLNWPALLAR
jgi:serine/threonine protein kinase/Tol biopolymer transport system component